MSCFCYLHIFPNEKLYVGSTQQKKVEDRWQNGNGYKKQPLIWNAICKYGWENVRHKVIVCETPEEMWEKERKLIKEYDTTNPEKGYNLSIGGEAGPIGCKRTETTRKKLSESHKDKKGYWNDKHFTEEHRKNLSESHKGKHPTEETRRKRSESLTGKRIGKNNPFYNHHHTEEARRKISEKLKNRPKPIWITPDGEIREMSVNTATQWHPDWTRIHYLDEAIRMKSNILVSRGETRFQGIIDNIYYFSFDGLFTELRQSLTQQYPEYMFSIMKDGEEDFIQGIFTHYDGK